MLNRIKAGKCPDCGGTLQLGTREFTDNLHGFMTTERFLWCPNRSCTFEKIYFKASKAMVRHGSGKST